MAFGDVLREFTPTWSPRGIAFDGKQLYVADTVGVCHVLDVHACNELRNFATPGNCHGLGFDGKNLYFAVFAAVLAQQTDYYGNVVNTYACPALGVRAGFSIVDQHIWMIDGVNNILELDRQFHQMRNIAVVPEVAYGITLDYGKNLYVTGRTNVRLYQYSEDGDLIQFVGLVIASGGVTGITFDGKTLWIGGFEPDRIYQVSLD